MSYLKRSTKIFAILFFICVSVLILYQSSFGRYVYDAIHNYILESQNFYFNSTILSVNNPTYSVADWDGVNSYPITIDVNSKKNELVSTKSDISYQIEVDCPSSVVCSLSKTEGVIDKDSKTDSYIVTVTPIESFYEGDSVIISTSATATSPYSKSISASYNIGVENYGFSYHIEDSVGSKFFTLELTNSRPYYIVNKAFDSYKVGDVVSLDVYQSLSDIQKANCVSLELSISFDPNYVLLDLNENIYLNSLSQSTTQINGYTYVNGITFQIGANSNEIITFYKNDINQDYTNSDIVQVTVAN